MNKLLFAHLALGPLMLLFASLFFFFPPKKVNYLYGYRTFRSMKSQEAWNFANRFSAKYLLGVSLITCLMQAFALTFFPVKKALFFSSVFLVVSLISVFPVTERMLQKKGFI